MLLLLTIILFLSIMKTSQAGQNGCTKTNSTIGDRIDNDCDGRIDEEQLNGLDNDGDGKVDEDATYSMPKIFPPKDYIGNRCDLNTHPSLTGFATGQDGGPCLRKGASWIRYSDYLTVVKPCSVYTRREWMLKDGCNSTASKFQIINITLAKLELKLPEIIENKCDQELPVFASKMVKYNRGKCSFPAIKIRLNSSFLSEGRCPHSKEIAKRTVSIKDGCGRLTQFNQIIISHPKVDVNVDASRDAGNEKEASVVGLTIFIIETLIIVACIMTRLRGRQRQLKRRSSRFRSRQRSNVESLLDYQVVELRESNL